MKTIKVTYTTKPEFSEQNQENIRQMMNDLQEAKREGLNYNACLAPDNKTFIHTAFFQSDDDQKFLNELPSFRHFQEQLKSGGLETPPKQELLTLVGTSRTIF